MKINSLLSTASLFLAVATAAPRRHHYQRASNRGGNEIRWGHLHRSWACPDHGNRPLSSLVSLPLSEMQPTANGFAACGQPVMLGYQGRTIIGYVGDTCVHCPGPVVSKELFQGLARRRNALRLGVLRDAQWSLGDASTQAASSDPSLDNTSASSSGTKPGKVYGPSPKNKPGGSGSGSASGASSGSVVNSVPDAIPDSNASTSDSTPDATPDSTPDATPDSTPGSTSGTTSGSPSTSSTSPNGSTNSKVSKSADDLLRDGGFGGDIQDFSFGDEPAADDPFKHHRFEGAVRDKPLPPMSFNLGGPPNAQGQ